MTLQKLITYSETQFASDESTLIVLRQRIGPPDADGSHRGRLIFTGPIIYGAPQYTAQHEIDVDAEFANQLGKLGGLIRQNFEQYRGDVPKVEFIASIDAQILIGAVILNNRKDDESSKYFIQSTNGREIIRVDFDGITKFSEFCDAVRATV